jgi:hypothetical protein
VINKLYEQYIEKSLYVYVPDGISDELRHFDLQIAELKPRFVNRSHISLRKQFRQLINSATTGRRHKHSISDMFNSLITSFVACLIFDSRELLLHKVAFTNGKKKIVFFSMVMTS